MTATLIEPEATIEEPTPASPRFILPMEDPVYKKLFHRLLLRFDLPPDSKPCPAMRTKCPMESWKHSPHEHEDGASDNDPGSYLQECGVDLSRLVTALGVHLSPYVVTHPHHLDRRKKKVLVLPYDLHVKGMQTYFITPEQHAYLATLLEKPWDIRIYRGDEKEKPHSVCARRPSKDPQPRFTLEWNAQACQLELSPSDNACVAIPYEPPPPRRWNPLAFLRLPGRNAPA